MKSTFMIVLPALSLLAVMAPPVRLGAQQQSAAQDQKPRARSYVITDLGPVGAAPGQPYYIANTGLVSGASTTPDGAIHAVLWYKKVKIDIATNGLGGPNSQAFGVNQWGQAVGEAESSVSNDEDFCGFQALGLPSSGKSCLPFVWQNGVMASLHTLGGANGAANMINARGEVVGLAENNKQDPGCPVSQFKPVIWENGRVRELQTSGNDPDGAALGINSIGQVVGVSGTCEPFNPNSQLYLLDSHALLWQNGTAKPRDLGNLGGTGAFGGNHACAINDYGQVVGHSDVTGDTTFYGFIWQNGVMKSLGALNEDVASLALGINDAGEVVGASLDANFSPRAFVWQKGEMIDLNTRVQGRSGLYLQIAESINASGEIIGVAQKGDEAHGFLATPIDHAGNGESSAAYAQNVSGPIVPSEAARRILRQRMGFGRFGARHN